MFTRVYLSLVLFNCLAQFSRACLPVYSCLLMLLVFTYVYSCLPMFTLDYPSLLVFMYVYSYLSMLTPCLLVPTYGLPLFAHARLPMLTPDYSCLPIFTLVSLPKFVFTSVSHCLHIHVYFV